MDLDHDLVRNRCREITESLERLDMIGKMSKEAFLGDQDTRDITSCRSLIAIEAALSLCLPSFRKRLRKVPESYADCFQLVGEAGLIPADLFKTCRKWLVFTICWCMSIGRLTKRCFSLS